jgi:GT2 family glycosyltransferase
MTVPSTFDPKQLAISIVSHGHGKLVREVLSDLQPLMRVGVQVILTLNIKEDEQFLEGFDYQPEVIRNNHAKGFGQNHNDAFARVSRPWFAVINPDVRLEANIFQHLLGGDSREKVGVVAPIIIGTDGQTQDSARHYPMLSRILQRLYWRVVGKKLDLEYQVSGDQYIQVDWLSGCFMVFNSKAFQAVNGFDISYFMYLEDADICRRLNKRGYEVLLYPSVQAIHDARHASHANWRHFHWHVKSMIRFLKDC